MIGLAHSRSSSTRGAVLAAGLALLSMGALPGAAEAEHRHGPGCDYGRGHGHYDRGYGHQRGHRGYHRGRGHHKRGDDYGYRDHRRYRDHYGHRSPRIHGSLEFGYPRHGFAVPQYIDDFAYYQPYYYGRTYYAPHRHHHPVYSFPVHGAYGPVYQPYAYCGPELFAGGYFTDRGPRFSISLHF